MASCWHAGKTGKTFLYANLKHWRREHPHKMAVQPALRRARKPNAEGDFTVEKCEALCEGYGEVYLRRGRGGHPSYARSRRATGARGEQFDLQYPAPLQRLQLLEEREGDGLPSCWPPLKLKETHSPYAPLRNIA